MPHSKDDHFLFAQSTKDAEAGFCAFHMRHAALLREVQAAPVRLIPRCALRKARADGRSSLNSGILRMSL